MEPITILVSALSLAGSALKPIAADVVKDSYVGLKRLIVERFGPKNPDLGHTLDKLEQNSEAYKLAAEAELKAAGAERDQELVDKATELLKQAEAAQPGVTGGLVGQINAQGGRVVVASNIQGGVQMGDQVNRSSGA
jgi:hypothetical protein